MISGPIVPQTRDSLRSLSYGHLARLERGLDLVRDAPAFEGVAIDGLLRDATGRPVLLFLAHAAQDDLPARVLAAREWFARHGRVLTRALGATGIVTTDRARHVVVSFAFTTTCLDRLRASHLDDLVAYRVEAIEFDGERHVEFVPELGGPLDEFESWSVPSGLGDGRHRLLCGELLKTARRVDPALEVRGDRFSRRCTARGRQLLEVWFENGRLWGRSPAGGELDRAVALRDRDAVAELADRVLRSYLALAGIGDGELPADAPADRALTDTDSSASERTFDEIRARVAGTEITEEEYDAFRDLDPRSRNG